MTIASPPPAGESGGETTRNEFSGVAHAVVQAGVITGGVVVHTTPANVVPIPRQLPPSVSEFSDRTAHVAELDTLLTSAAGDPGPTAISTISGMAGVGKTALVIHWAHQVRKRFPDGHLYVDLHGYGPSQPLDAADVLDQFLRALGVGGEEIPKTLADRASRFRTLVDQRKILVILDNASTADQVRPLLPGTSSCFVVVTSRDALSGLVAREGARRIDLDMLPLADATALLQALAGPRLATEPEAAKELAQHCARLPLALRIAAELANARPAARVGELVTELADEQQRLDLLDAGDDESTAVRSVFAWSYRHLREPAARVFRLLGLLPGYDTDLGGISALADVAASSCRKLIADLVRAHLLDETAGGRYRTHDLLRVYAAELVHEFEPESSRRQARDRLFGHFAHSAAIAVSVVTPTGIENDFPPEASATLTTSVRDETGAIAWLEAERANIILTVGMFGNAHPEHTVRIAALLARYLSAYAYHSDALVLHTHALAAASLLEDHLEISRALNNLGVTYRRLGHYDEALEHHQRARAAADRTGDQPEAARALNELGIIHRRLGRYTEALEYHRQALAIHIATGNRAAAGRTRNDLGIAHRRLGRFDRALEQHHQALATARELESGIDQCNALTSLGIVHRRLGEFDRALTWHREALAIHRRIGNRVGEASALTRMGMVFERMKRPADALDYFGQALIVHRATGNRQQEGRSLNNLGIAYRKLGSHQKALEHLKQALAIHEETGNRIDEGHALNALGLTYLESGRQDEALSLLDRALAAHRATGNRVEEGHVLNNLGLAHSKAGDRPRALTCLRQALAIASETGNHELTTATLRNLGSASDAAGEPSAPDVGDRETE